MAVEMPGPFPYDALFAPAVRATSVEVLLKVRALGWLILAASSSLLAGCGGGSSSPNPVPSAAPPGATRVVILDNASFTLQPGTATYKNIDQPPAGTIDGTLDWSGGADMNLYVTDNTCAGFNTLQSGGCNVLARAEGTAKPERLTFTAAANRIYTFWIHNNGTAMESGGLTVGDTTTHPISQPGPTPTPGAGGAGA